ncbi:MAG: hypothetical protein GX228_02805 [Firmicutes bacterium]|nr:hypothetical protein [Bacillota bacterium]NLL87850.1 hypothetical protein [Bacillota bacterium]
MAGKFVSTSRMAVFLVVAMLFAGCFGIGQLKDRKAVEAEIARFQENIVSSDLDGYHALKKQFADPYIWHLDEDQLSPLLVEIDYIIERYIVPILENQDDPEFDPYDEYTPAYIIDKIDALIALYEEKERNLEDPEVTAAIEETAEEVLLYEVFSEMYHSILELEEDAEPDDNPDSSGDDDFDDSQVQAWLSRSKIVDTGFQWPNDTVIYFMFLVAEPDFTWSEEVILEQNGNQWVAEIPFSFTNEWTDETEAGLVVLTFKKLSGKWKITVIQLLSDEEEQSIILGL